VTDVVEDDQCPLPGLSGLPWFTGGVARIPELGKDLCFTVAVAVVPAQAERDLEVSGGLGEVTKMVLDVTESVPDAIFETARAELGYKGERLLAERLGLLVVAEEGVEPGDAAEHFGLPVLMADGPEKAECLFTMSEGVGVAALNPG
jgi:hypothetical protein